jgi:hypothetical protein
MESGQHVDSSFDCQRYCGRRLLGVLAALPFVGGSLLAEPVSVRYREGSVQGFLALRTLEGKVLAAGDLTQIIHGDRVVSHLVFRFKDGSVDDETAVFSQHGTFRLISDHHIQKGPIFPFRKGRYSRNQQISRSTPLPVRLQSAIKTKTTKKSKLTTLTFHPI